MAGRDLTIRARDPGEQRARRSRDSSELTNNLGGGQQEGSRQKRWGIHVQFRSRAGQDRQTEQKRISNEGPRRHFL